MPPDARAYLKQILTSFGLESLVAWAFEQIAENRPQEQILLDMRERPEYIQRFPAMKALGAKNRAMSEGEYVAYEKSVAGLMQLYGLPPGFYDQPEDFAKFLENDVSPQELQARIGQAASASLTAPIEIKQQLKELYGVEQGDLTAYFLDPTVATGVLEQRYVAAQAGSAAKETGFGTLTKEAAERVSTLKPQNVQKTFAELTQQKELFQAQAGEGVDLTQAQQLEAGFGGDAQTLAEVERRRSIRTATFKGQGGQFAQGRGGAIAGLGQAE